jgi:hypothetical protein
MYQVIIDKETNEPIFVDVGYVPPKQTMTEATAATTTATTTSDQWRFPVTSINMSNVYIHNETFASFNDSLTTMEIPLRDNTTSANWTLDEDLGDQNTTADDSHFTTTTSLGLR